MSPDVSSMTPPWDYSVRGVIISVYPRSCYWKVGAERTIYMGFSCFSG